jgi:hypothetical protein
VRRRRLRTILTTVWAAKMETMLTVGDSAGISVFVAFRVGRVRLVYPGGSLQRIWQERKADKNHENRKNDPENAKAHVRANVMGGS